MDDSSWYGTVLWQLLESLPYGEVLMEVKLDCGTKLYPEYLGTPSRVVQGMRRWHVRTMSPIHGTQNLWEGVVDSADGKHRLVLVGQERHV